MPFPLSVLALLSAWSVLSAPLHAQVRGVLVDDVRAGQRAPALVLPYVTAEGAGAEPYELRRELGRVVVLAFCERLEEPGCTALWRGWARPDTLFGAGVSVVGVVGDGAERAREFAVREGVWTRFLTDDRGIVSRRWGVMAGGNGGIGVFVVAGDGVVAYRDLQFPPDDLHAWQRVREAVEAARR